MLKFIFWLSFLTVFYTFFGYPMVLSAWRALRGKTIRKGRIFPSVSMVIAVYNEEKVIERKLANLLRLEYPPSLLEIILSSDGSTDRTEERIARWMEKSSGAPPVRLLKSSAHAGKAAALNRGVEHARGEIVLFSDARQLLDSISVLKLVSNFADPEVGAASGELILLERKNGEAAVGIGLYWRYEKWLRKMESEIDSTLGATGALYAIRKGLYEPIPADTILDDVLIPMRIVFKGYRAVFEPEARAYDLLSSRTRNEFVRKVRTLAGNYQLLWEVGALWSPKKNRLFFQYFSHKVARLIAPFMLVLLFFCNFFLLQGFYLVFLILQIIWYGLALWGGMSHEKAHAKAA